MKTKFSVLALSFIVGGCSLVPNYNRPDLPISGEFEVSAITDSSTAIEWHDVFLDDSLKQLITKALDENRTYQQAFYNVKSVQALYQIQKSAELPEVDAGVSLSRQSVPASLATMQRWETTNQMSFNTQLSYELDVFGKLSSLSDAALQSYLASEEEKNAVQISLIAQVASAYYSWKSSVSKVAIYESLLINAETQLQLSQEKLSSSMNSEIELSRAKSVVNDAKQQLSEMTKQQRSDEYLIELLVGANVDSILASAKETPIEGLAPFPVGTPSDLLLNRPDIRSAENVLKAANARIGAARAAFFPSVRLTTSGGLASDDVSRLFDGGSGAWTFSPQISLPIFNGGRLKANLAYSEHVKEREIASYELTIQTAFKEVRDSLATKQSYEQQLELQLREIENSRSRLALISHRVNEGVDSYETQLAEERQLLRQEELLTNLRYSTAASCVLLYKSVGGGWQI